MLSSLKKAFSKNEKKCLKTTKENNVSTIKTNVTKCFVFIKLSD